MPTPPPTRIPRLAYSPQEAADLLGVSRVHVYAMMEQGLLPSVKLGRSRRIPAGALVELIEGGAA